MDEEVTPNSGAEGSAGASGTNPVKEQEVEEVLADDTVLIIGGGPVGMMTATVLAFYGIRSIVLERNFTTTRWPKMDLTNVRSMEFFRKLGLAEGLRERGVPSHIPYTVLISSGLSQDSAITQWNHPSVDEYRQMIAERNDGTMPLEPWQRISQEIFEAWLKQLSEANELIDLRFGWKLETIQETGEGVEATVTDLNSSKIVKFRSRYAVGCDGASSRVRRNLNIPLDGGPVPGFVLLVHFKSNDLARLHKQGRFWHLFMAGEHDTFTTHLFLPMDADESATGTEEAVYRVLGGMYQPYEVKIDQVLVRSTYRPSVAVARQYSSPQGWIYLAGDSAHQNIPTGGYGMNMGLGDAYDIGWKLAAVLQGWAGKGVLQSYQEERRPVALTNVERSGVHMAVHGAVPNILKGFANELDADTDKGRQLRQEIHQHYQANDGENTDRGIEMGYRYKSTITIPDTTTKEPNWTAHEYVPTTWPGSRPPHVFLEDGKTAIFDLLGKYFTLVHFISGDTDTAGHAEYFDEAAKTMGIPLEHVILKNEDHARTLWERDLVLIRPDGHVSWRGDTISHRSTAFHVLEVAVGHHFDEASSTIAQQKTDVNGEADNKPGKEQPREFTLVGEVKSQDSEYQLDKMGEFQK
ncbi:hypothetical protein AYO21_10540 [Fonsecaea monophora]|uniref:FAD-binding domain-containing protein n=1 Tax=Fonsecaea monophora TaxID=254056 RepID=A0A177EWE5_9EURO|nr:hypothetical protein AYO21_10540 [Fonsecaea monophora]OAG35269.1 hypothetical protein AYO21_10540 [Fonsecaea monophora]